MGKNNKVQVYKENETFVDQAKLLKLQIEGALKNFYEIGNDIKPQTWKEKIDAPIIIAWAKGQRAIGNPDYKGLDDSQLYERALEKSQRMQEFHKQVRKFSDATEKGEHTMKETCNYLEGMINEGKAENQRWVDLLPSLEKYVGGKYDVRDLLFAQRREKDFSESRNAKTESRVTEFRKNVDGAYEEVRREMPIEEYSDKNWVDVVTNPLNIGLIVAAAGYGASRVVKSIPVIGKYIVNPVSKVLAAPVMLPLRGAAAVGKGVFNGGKKLINKFRKSSTMESGK